MIRYLRARAFRLALNLLASERSADRRPGKNPTFARSLKNALRGILITFATERNFRFECAVAAAVIAAGIGFRISGIEWAILTTNVFAVLALEANNTSAELTTDLATKDYDYDAKTSKDASSGAVLLATFSSIIVGLIVFFPHVAAQVREMLR
jgi:undecaprenol kinase